MLESFPRGATQRPTQLSPGEIRLYENMEYKFWAPAYVRRASSTIFEFNSAQREGAFFGTAEDLIAWLQTLPFPTEENQRKRQTPVAGVSGPQILDADLEASIAEALKDLGL